MTLRNVSPLFTLFLACLIAAPVASQEGPGGAPPLADQKTLKLKDDALRVERELDAQTAAAQKAHLDTFRAEVQAAQKGLGATDPADPRAVAAAQERLRVARIRLDNALAARRLNPVFREGTAAELQAMKVGDIVKMQIYRLVEPDWVARGDKTIMVYKKQYAAHHFGTEYPVQIETVLALLKRAKRPEVAAGGRLSEPLPHDRVLVVQPREGEPFEIPYALDFDAPFAGFSARSLKEVLYVLGNGRHRLTLMQLEGGRITRTTTQSLNSASQGVALRAEYDPRTGLNAHVKVSGADHEVVIDQAMPVAFGEARVCPSQGPGTWILLLQEP